MKNKRISIVVVFLFSILFIVNCSVRDSFLKKSKNKIVFFENWKANNKSVLRFTSAERNKANFYEVFYKGRVVGSLLKTKFVTITKRGRFNDESTILYSYMLGNKKGKVLMIAEITLFCNNSYAPSQATFLRGKFYNSRNKYDRDWKCKPYIGLGRLDVYGKSLNSEEGKRIRLDTQEDVWNFFRKYLKIDDKEIYNKYY